MKFTAVLLLPLAKQNGGSLIDPEGVNFDPTEQYVIWRDFNYSVPRDIVGFGHVRRDPDLGLLVEGDLTIDIKEEVERDDFPHYLAVGVVTKERDHPIRHSDLMAIGFTADPADSNHPPITFGGLHP